MEPLRWSVISWPATVGTIEFGGTWRRPGPRRSAFFFGLGMTAGSIESPGRTIIRSVAAIFLVVIVLALRFRNLFSLVWRCALAGEDLGRQVLSLGGEWGGLGYCQCMYCVTQLCCRVLETLRTAMYGSIML
jgi:hypothetical protein